MLQLPAAQRDFLLRVATLAGHQGEAPGRMLERLESMLAPEIAARSKGNAARGAFSVARGIAKAAKEVEAIVGSYLGPEDIRQESKGCFDARSLGCWLAVAELAGVAAVPAIRLLTLPEPVLELIISPELVDQPPRPQGAVNRILDGIAGGALSRAFGLNDRLESAAKREIHAIGLSMLAEAGSRIPPGHMVRHDHMGPGTLKAWAGVGWEPWNGDDGVSFRDEAGRDVTFGPGWMALGNQRYVDVVDARTTMAIAQAMTFDHVFWARPWIRPARRIVGFDPHRPDEWPEEQRRGSWPAEWRVFIRGGRAVGVAAYYGWAEAAGDVHDLAMATEALRLAQAMADAATVRGVLPDEPRLIQLRRRSAEIRERLPEGTVNAALDFIETEEGLVFLEGAPPYAPGGFGAHPCAAAGQRWPEGFAFRTAPGIDLADIRSWGAEALAPPR